MWDKYFSCYASNFSCLLDPIVQRPRKIISKLNQVLKKVPFVSLGQVDFLAGKVTFKAQGLGMSSSYEIIN